MYDDHDCEVFSDPDGDGIFEVVENPNPNPKITVPQDLAIVEFLYEKGVL